MLTTSYAFRYFQTNMKNKIMFLIYFTHIIRNVMLQNSVRRQITKFGNFFPPLIYTYYTARGVIIDSGDDD